jgi:ABC-type branched-subunit amino acid transport system substrate-binding protein
MVPAIVRLPVVLAVSLAVGSGVVLADKKYGPGVTDAEIKIGQTQPYSGPASSYGTIGKAEAAYFKMINDQGGVNGRRINLISLDDGYSPPRAVEQIRRLVEQEHVLLLFNTLGTPTNTAIHKYVNARRVPHILLATGATKWGDPEHYPWTIGFQPYYQAEARIYAKYIRQIKPNAKIAILYQNDDYGKDYVKGFKDGLGDKASLIVKEVSYEVTDPTIDSQIVALQASGADVFFNVSIPKFAAQSIRKTHDLGWKPLHIINSVATFVASVLVPAGLDKSVGLVSTSWFKDPTDPQWKDDSATKDWLAWMKKYYPDGNLEDANNVYGYTVSQALVEVLKRCGDDLTRENVMRQVANLKELALPMLLPGIKVNTSPTDFYPVEQMQLMRFDRKQWIRFGEIIDASRSH